MATSTPSSLPHQPQLSSSLKSKSKLKSKKCTTRSSFGILSFIALVITLRTVYLSTTTTTTYDSVLIQNENELISTFPANLRIITTSTNNNNLTTINNDSTTVITSTENNNTTRTDIDVTGKVHRMAKPPEDINFTYFFSHIPKSGSEYAHKTLQQLLLSTIPINSTKSWSSYAYNPRQNQDNLNPNPGADNPPPMFCYSANSYIGQLRQYFNEGAFPFSVYNFTCVMWTTEQHYSPFATRGVYTIIREPISHTLSQYFHCKESIDHKKQRTIKIKKKEKSRDHLMPKLDDWLNSYSNLVNDTYEYNGLKQNYHKLIDNTTDLFEEIEQYSKSIRLMSRYQYHCYDPINSQSKYTKFPPTNIILPKNYSYEYNNINSNDINGNENDNDNDNDKNKNKKNNNIILDQILFNDLKKKYNIIGDTSRMTKTVCAIFIDYAEGKYIPEPCDCSNDDNNNNNNNNISIPLFDTDNRFKLKNLYHDPKLEGMYMRSGAAMPLLVAPEVHIGYNKEKHSHGVKHHGSSYVKNGTGLFTEYAKQQIINLRRVDNILYNISRHVFDIQIIEMETKYNIQICNEWYTM